MLKNKDPSELDCKNSIFFPPFFTFYILIFPYVVSLGIGKNADELLLKENTALVASFTPASGAFPSTIIGVMSRFRELYKNAIRLQEYQKSYGSNPVNVNRPIADKCLESFFPVLDGKIPFIFQAPDMKSVYRVQALKNESSPDLLLGKKKPKPKPSEIIIAAVAHWD